MANGLLIDETQFKRLPQDEQSLILYQNTEEIKQLIAGYNEILDGYKFHQNIQYVWLSIITVAVGAAKFLGFL